MPCYSCLYAMSSLIRDKKNLTGAKKASTLKWAKNSQLSPKSFVAHSVPLNCVFLPDCDRITGLQFLFFSPKSYFLPLHENPLLIMHQLACSAMTISCHSHQKRTVAIDLFQRCGRPRWQKGVIEDFPAPARRRSRPLDSRCGDAG